MFQTKFEEKKETHFVPHNFFFENLTIYETRWKYTVKPGSLQMTIWRKRIACWIPKATNTYSEYVIRIAFPLLHGCKNAPQYYVIGTLPVLLPVMRTSLNVHLKEVGCVCFVLCVLCVCCVFRVLCCVFLCVLCVVGCVCCVVLRCVC